MTSSRREVAKLFRRAVAHHDGGRAQQAETLYREVLALDPAHAECHYRLGILVCRSGRNDVAIGHIVRAIELEPRAAEYHLDLGIILSGLGRFQQAEASYRRALRLLPNDPWVHSGLGRVLGQLGRNEEAAAHCCEALRLEPDFPEAHNNLAQILDRLGRLEEAAASCREALRLRPDFLEAQNNLAHLLRRLGRFEESVAACLEALRRKPDYVEAQVNLGQALSCLSRFEEAEACYRHALRFKPALPEVHHQLGNVLSDLHRFEEAVGCYREALRLEPGMPDAWNSRGLALAELGRPDEAGRCYDEALRLRPDFIGARVNRCMGHLRILYRDEEEIARARSVYAAELEALCRGDARPVLPAPVGGKTPFLLAYQARCDRDLQALYGGFVARAMASLYPAWSLRPAAAPPRPGEPVRVGMLSAHFFSHSNWNIPIKGWLLGLDKRRFQLFGYHIGRHQDGETALARELCHRFVQGLPTFRSWVETIRADRLHVLLIPGIGMDTATVQLAALRLAPVQATSWGHPDTSGLPTVDHYLSSELMEPPGADAHYTEQLVRLPNLSIWYEPPARIPEAVSRAEIGVPEAAILYWCCQTLFKYLPRYDWVFPRIAAAVPDACFVFIEYPFGDMVTALFRERLDAAFAAAGLDAARHCRFLPSMSPARFAGISRLADVFLDSLGWSGCNSTLEALACDLPVVTMAGELMRGRHSAAILAMLGMPDFVADTAETFAELAIALGRDEARRRALASRIARDKHRLYRDQACIDGLARYLHDAAQGLGGPAAPQSIGGPLPPSTSI